MPPTDEFRRAIFNWNGDNYSQLYEFLQSKFQAMPDAAKKGLEEETLQSLKYVPNNKKKVTALLFLQNK